MAFKDAFTVLLLSLLILSAQARRKSRKGKTKHEDSSTPSTRSVATVTGKVQGDCSSLDITNPVDQTNPPEVTMSRPTWLQTPSIVEIAEGHYQALGRVIHMKYLQERLSTHFNFNPTRETMDLVEQLDILADTLYIEDSVFLIGIRNVKIYAREIVSASGNEIEFSAPNWDQQFETGVQTGRNGEDGNHGENGPQLDIFCDVITGVLDVTSNAGDGHQGQDGGRGEIGPSRDDTPNALTWKACTDQTERCTCDDVKGRQGLRGRKGGRGGNAGTPGNGGNAGNVNIRYRMLTGRVKLKSCRGTGAQPAENGRGGEGGPGGRGGLGRDCRLYLVDILDRDKLSVSQSGSRGLRNVSRSSRTTREKRRVRTARNLECPEYPDRDFFCRNDGVGGEDLRGDTGPQGNLGPRGSTPNTPGEFGSVSASLVQSGALDAASKQSFPPELLVIMRRQAEDLLLSDSDSQKGREALEFILSVANEISGNQKVERIKKYVKRKLAFLGKEGYDIFGNNKLFAPRIKWEALEGTVEAVKDAAGEYEDAFNDIISKDIDAENFKQMGSLISEVSSRQVNAEKERLVQAKYIAETEKNLYVKGIQYEEEEMTSILQSITAKIDDVYDDAKFNKADLLAVLQGIVGFSKAIADLSPGDFIDTALSLAGSLSNKECLQSLDSHLDSIKKWLTFGENYQPLEDSSQLDFDQLDVTAIPEIMQANLEMNKETFAHELVCLLDVASRPQDLAEFKAEIETFFIAGAARIDLIGKVMDLDNDIGGYIFDIPLLEETENAIAEADEQPDDSLSVAVRQNFLDYLLSTYRTLERSFMRNLYELHKAFEFRTLWEGNNPLDSFQRVASESALGTGRLNGAVQLTDVLTNMKRLQDKAVKCFTNNIYATGIKRWHFNIGRDRNMFEEIAEGYTRFILKVDRSCDNCYNLRLLKIYIELFGEPNDEQPDSVPAKVQLQVRHLSASYFRAGDNEIKQYRQPIGSYRNIKFDRFSITKLRQCQESKTEGKCCSLFCLNEDDSRWQPMCTNQLTKGGSLDKLLGMEECKSPFGIYELKIPKDNNLACDDNRITNTNCRDIDRSKFTKMNVWANFIYWSDHYPTGPDDRLCRAPSHKRNKMPPHVHQFTASPDDKEGCC